MIKKIATYSYSFLKNLGIIYKQFFIFISGKSYCKSLNLYNEERIN